MVDDMVKRARWMANGEARAGIGKVRGALFRELADEIERLRDETQELRRLLVLVDGPARLQEIERLRHPKIIVGSRKLWEAMGKVISEAEDDA